MGKNLDRHRVFSGGNSHPDENVFYTHRQHVNFPHITTEKEGLAIMQSIRDDMLKAREEGLSSKLNQKIVENGFMEYCHAILC